jgi:hypothetical protein
MSTDSVQTVFPWHIERPLCSRCGVHGVAVEPITGTFLKMCGRCLARGRKTEEKRRRAGKLKSHKRSAAERNAARRRVRDQVFAALGNRCGCTDPTCWHGDAPCPVNHPDALTVDHMHGNGHRVRNYKRDGSRSKRALAAPWERYLRELRKPNHGLQPLCGTCHLIKSARERRASAANGNGAGA